MEIIGLGPGAPGWGLLALKCALAEHGGEQDVLEAALEAAYAFTEGTETPIRSLIANKALSAICTAWAKVEAPALAAAGATTLLLLAAGKGSAPQLIMQPETLAKAGFVSALCDVAARWVSSREHALLVERPLVSLVRATAFAEGPLRGSQAAAGDCGAAGGAWPHAEGGAPPHRRAGGGCKSYGRHWLGVQSPPCRRRREPSSLATQRL